MISQNLDYKLIHNIDDLESQRLIKQAQADALKSAKERNRLGQYATPNPLAIEILNYSKSLFLINERIRFLDPAIGTGSFYSAFLKITPLEQIESAVGYEIDQNYAGIALRLWANTPLEINVADFTEASPPKDEKCRANLLVCNPPYVRHQHLSLDQKKSLKTLGIKSTGIRLNGLSGLYCYFLLVSHKWMTQNGLACWIIPCEFMDVNYGKKVKDYLLSQVTLIRIHQFDSNNLQFDGVLVSTSVIWLRNIKPDHEHSIEFTSGESISNPSTSKFISSTILRQKSKWSRVGASDIPKKSTQSEVRLSDFFDIKRGIATGANNFFILASKQISQLSIPSELLTPILPSPRDLPEDEVFADEQGNPNLEHKLFLLTCKLQVDEIRIQYPSVWNYLQLGVDIGIPERYLCKHRSLWYLQELRKPTPFLCTYMGRYQSKTGKPFRFIFNRSNAIAPNVYLMMYPKQKLADLLVTEPNLSRVLWKALNSISMQSLISEGRVYGDGLHKLEPRELANVSADTLLKALENSSHVYT